MYNFFFSLLLQETDILTDNLAKHILNDSEVLFETRDLRTLANLQESMVRDSPLLHDTLFLKTTYKLLDG